MTLEPVIDAFLHAPWIGGDEGDLPRADIVPWTGDRRLQRVMSTFHHESEPDGMPKRVGLESLLATMASAGVGSGLLISKVYYASTIERVRRLHEELASLSARSGGALKWVATIVPPAHGAGSYWDLMANPRLLAELAADRNCVGVHITPSPWGLPPNDRWYYPLYAACCDLKLTLFTYVGMPGPLWPMHPNDPAHLDDVALAFPDLPIVAHHIGDPWVGMMVRLAARHHNVHICTSAWYPKAYPSELMAFMAGSWHGQRGCEKVIFASDHPLLDMGKTVAAARNLDLDAGVLRRVLNDNAEELFFA